VIDWTRDRITPTAPYDNSDGAMTDAYAAELHTRVTIEAPDVSYSDSLRQLLFMLSYLLIERPGIRLGKKVAGWLAPAGSSGKRVVAAH
jgi:hypothetical protein